MRALFAVLTVALCQLAAPAMIVEYRPSPFYTSVLDFEVLAPESLDGVKPKEWVVFASVPPQLKTQPTITASLEVVGRDDLKAQRILEPSSSDPSWPAEVVPVARRPLLVMRVPYTADQKSLQMRIVYPKVEAYSEFLRFGENHERVRLPDIYLQQYLLPTPTMNFEDPVLARWISDNITLPTTNATSPYTRATTLVDRLIELFHGRVLDHDAVPERSLAEAVTSDGGLTGAEIAELMVAVLRSYGDPARLRVQKHWKQTGDVPEISGRMVGVQFFYDRIGWVNCFPGAAAKNGGVGNSGAFGMYMSSTGITYHLDTDLRLPVTEEVVRVKRWMINPAAYLVDEDGVVLDCGVVCQRLAETLHKPPR